MTRATGLAALLGVAALVGSCSINESDGSLVTGLYCWHETTSSCAIECRDVPRIADVSHALLAMNPQGQVRIAVFQKLSAAPQDFSYYPLSVMTAADPAACRFVNMRPSDLPNQISDDRTWPQACLTSPYCNLECPSLPAALALTNVERKTTIDTRIGQLQQIFYGRQRPINGMEQHYHPGTILIRRGAECSARPSPASR